MHCQRCDTPNEAGSRFCRVCGTPLQMTPAPYVVTNAPMTGEACPACRGRNPRGARFCVFCAMPLIATPAPAPAMSLQPAGVSASAAVYINQPALRPAQHVYANRSSNLLVRAVWFFFVGWWLGLIWTLVAWLFNLTLIGLPVGLMMLNAIPTVMTLRTRNGGPRNFTVLPTGAGPRPAEQPFAIRALWFVFIGWWASFLWMFVGWMLCSTLLLMPIAFWMFDRVPTITTLAAE